MRSRDDLRNMRSRALRQNRRSASGDYSCIARDRTDAQRVETILALLLLVHATYVVFFAHIPFVVNRALQRNASDVVEHRQASQLMCERQTTSHGTLSINARDFACSVCLY